VRPRPEGDRLEPDRPLATRDRASSGDDARGATVILCVFGAWIRAVNAPAEARWASADDMWVYICGSEFVNNETSTGSPDLGSQRSVYR